jgi:hypothetical protein
MTGAGLENLQGRLAFRTSIPIFSYWRVRTKLDARPLSASNRPHDQKRLGRLRDYLR